MPGTAGLHNDFLTKSPGSCTSQRWRETSEEKRELERLEFDTLNEVRQAAEVHRQVLLLCPEHAAIQRSGLQATRTCKGHTVVPL